MGGYLKDKTAYLCGNIALSQDDGVGWRNYIEPKLVKFGINVINPCKKTTQNISEIGDDKKRFREIIMQEDWKKIKEVFWPIVRADLRSIDKCDFIILNYDPYSPTIGTIHELVVATYEKKVILLKYDKAQLDKFNPWMATFIKEHHFFSDWNNMLEYLTKVDNGIVDTSLWVI